MKPNWALFIVLAVVCTLGLAVQDKPVPDPKATPDPLALTEVETLKAKNLDLELVKAQQEQEILRVRFQQMQDRYAFLERQIEVLRGDIQRYEKTVLTAHKAEEGSRVDSAAGKIVPPPPKVPPVKPPDAKVPESK